MGYVCAFAAVFFWSFNLIIASYFATSLNPWEIAFGRWFVAALILVPLTWKSLKHNYTILKDNLRVIFALGLSGIVIDNTLIYYAGRTTSAIDMGLLDVTGPIFLVLLSKVFLKTIITPQQILGLIVAVFGVVIIILQGDFKHLSDFKFVSGDFLMLINTFAFAVYSLLQYKRPKQVSQQAMLAASVIAGLIIILPIMLLVVPQQQLLEFNVLDLGTVVYLGIFNSVLSYLCWNTALSKIGNIKTSIIYYLLPLFSGIEAYFILGEKFYTSQFIGGFLVIIGIAMVTLLKRQKNADK